MTSAAARITLPGLMLRATMILHVPVQTAAAGVRHVAVSLPRIDCLVADQPAKYALPESLPAPTSPPHRVRGHGRMSHDDRRFIEKRLADGVQEFRIAGPTPRHRLSAGPGGGPRLDAGVGLRRETPNGCSVVRFR